MGFCGVRPSFRVWMYSALIIIGFGWVVVVMWTCARSLMGLEESEE